MDVLKTNLRFRFLTRATLVAAFLCCLISWNVPTRAEGEKTSADSVFVCGTNVGERCVLEVDGVEYAFRWIPSGRFLMGSPEDEENHNDYEIQHVVVLTKGFWILETETTQKMWSSVCGSNPSKFLGDNKPVDTVGLDEIAAFCQKLKERSNAPDDVAFSLPTEAQWEYVARAGGTSAYVDENLDAIAWYGDENYSGTRDVATKRPNAWGVYDMIGNLWEWCSDRFAAYPTDDDGRGKELTDPIGATLEECPGDIRVDRGACWDSKTEECRVAYRGYYDADRKGPYVGFRFIVTPVQK